MKTFTPFGVAVCHDKASGTGAHKNNAEFADKINVWNVVFDEDEISNDCD